MRGFAGTAARRASGRRWPVRPELLFLAAIILPSLFLAALAVRAIGREEAYLEKQLRDTLSAETVSLASLVAAELKAAETELAWTLPPVGPGGEGLAGWAEASALVEVPFLISPDYRVVWPRPAAAEERGLLEEQREFLENRLAVPSYRSVARAYLEEILPASAGPAGSTREQGEAQGEARAKGAAQAPHSENPALVQQAASRLEIDEVVRKRVYEQARDEGQQLLERNVAPAGNGQPSQFISENRTVEQITAGVTQGMIPRLIGDGLALLFWRRLPSGGIAGCSVRLEELRRRFLVLMPPVHTPVRVLTLLDERGEPLPGEPLRGRDYRRPFAAREVSELLPRWEAAAYLADPSLIDRRVRRTRTVLGLLVAILFVAVAGGGSVLLGRMRGEVVLARQKTSFLAHVSHQLKTPLTSIRLYADMLREGRLAQPERRDSYLRTMSAEAQRLTGLVNDVLDYARLEQGRGRFSFRPLDAARLGEETLDGQRDRLEKAGFALSFAGSPGCTVSGDREALRQVLLNLISNSEKYSEGWREIRLEVLTAGAGRAAGVRLRLLDRGRGVPAREARHIFREFYRADEALTAPVQGAGLGLSIARRIVEAHGGRIRCLPREGGGSVFEVRLPRCARGEAEREGGGDGAQG